MIVWQRPLSRRNFLTVITAGIAYSATSVPADNTRGLIASIEKITLRKGRDGSGPTWFHPRACIVPTAAGPQVFMTLQTISGSDVFGPVHWMTSPDLGKTWTDPQPVPPLARVPANNGWEEGVCDVVPEYHAPTKTVLAMGHNVFYRGPKFDTQQPPRWPVYSVWNNGTWGERRKLEWDDPRGSLLYTNNCGQRVVLDNGDIAFVMSFGNSRTSRSAAGVHCTFDGRTLAIKHVGKEMKHTAGRGLLEPSLVRWRNRFFVTLRAEDNHGYVAVSNDGLDFTEKQPWCWDDGEAVTMSTTQQHWLAHSDGLFLVYNRKDASNINVPRWRAPLYIAQVDPEKLRLIRETERIVLPLVGDGVKAPNDVAYSGNFHPVNVSPDESWVTDGEMLPKHGYRGDLLLGRIRWAVRNQSVMQ